MLIHLIMLAALFIQVPTTAQTAAGSIEGIVVRMGSNEPIAGADVELTRVEPPVAPSVFRAKTIDDGKFVLKNIPDGRYRLVATRPGGMFSPAEYEQRDPRGRGTMLELRNGEAISGVRLSMSATGAISGRVFDADQDPVPNARVMALEGVYQNGQRTLSTVQAVRTNDLGEYRLFWLRPGRYYVGVMREDLRTFSFVIHVTPPDQFGRREDASSPVVRERLLDDGRVVEETSALVYYGGGLDPDKAQAIDVLPGASVGTVDVAVQQAWVRTHRVLGSIMGTNGEPAAGALIRLVPLQPSPHVIIPNATADKKGVFIVVGVIPGSYMMLATMGATTGYSFNEGLLDISNGSSSMQRIDVADQDLENISIVLKPPFSISGRVAAEGITLAKWDLTQARLSAVREPNLLGLPNVTGLGDNSPTRRPSGIPSGDGTFVLGGLSEGNYRINIAGIPPSAYVKAIQFGGVDVLQNGLQLERVAPAQLDVLLNLEGGAIEGSAINDKSEPVKNATVILIPDAPLRGRTHLHKVAASDATGRFEITGIAPGMYKVFAWESVTENAWQDPEFLRNFEADGKSIRFIDGSRQQIQITVSSKAEKLR